MHRAGCIAPPLRERNAPNTGPLRQKRTRLAFHSPHPGSTRAT
jgi:hypothetical protein